MMKQFVHAQKQIGMDKVVLPTDKSNKNDWDAFYNATGRPETVEGYKFEKDENFKDHYDDNLISEFMKGAHEVGITEKQMAFLNAFENQRIKYGLEALQQQNQREHDEADTAVQALWGAAYKQMKHLANLFVNENTEEGDDRDSILEIVGNNPQIANLFAKASKKYIAEHQALIGEMKTPTPKDAESKINELQATEGYITGELASTNPAKFKNIKAEIQKLYEIAYPGS
jgi:hypothetical protein